MGNKNNNRQFYCHICKQKQNMCPRCNACSDCNPIRNCQQCLIKNPKNITCKINYEELIKIYNEGIIKSVKSKTSKVQGSSKIPFVKGLQHFFLQLTIYVKDVKFTTLIIQAQRTKGKTEIIIQPPFFGDHQFEQYNTNIRFSDLYHHAWRNEHGQQFGILGNNCFHIGIRLLKFIVPNLSAQHELQIMKYKDDFCRF